MIYKNNHYSVKDILLRYPIPYISKYYGPFGLKKGAQRKWCKKMIREEGKRIRKLEEEKKKNVKANKI